MAKFKGVERVLLERRDRLTRSVGKIEGDLRSTHDRDWPERASEVANDEVLEGLDAMGRVELEEIRAALQRLASGAYGLCSRCGTPIGPGRLAAIPTTVTCVRCAAAS